MLVVASMYVLLVKKCAFYTYSAFVFRSVVRINSEYYPIQHKPDGLLH